MSVCAGTHYAMFRVVGKGSNTTLFPPRRMTFILTFARRRNEKIF